MERLRLSVDDHEILEILDEHPLGLHLTEIGGLFEQDMSLVIRRLLHVGVLERMPGGTFRTLGCFHEEGGDPCR